MEAAAVTSSSGTMWACETVEDFLKIFKSRLAADLLQLTGETAKDNTFLETAKAYLKKAGDLAALISPSHSEAEKQLKEAVTMWAHGLLEASFMKESELVEQDFPQEKTSTLQSIFSVLQDIRDGATQLAMVLRGNGTVEDAGIDDGVLRVLGMDMVEILHWRCGALHYMQIATYIKSNRTATLQVSSFEECVKELDAMLQVRKGRMQINDDDELSKHGIFSSTHLLAMMYGGEVCYWRHTLMAPHVESRQKGVEWLSSFQKLIQMLPESHGWSDARAIQLVQELQKQ